MKKLSVVLLVSILFTCCELNAQTVQPLHKYIIERDIPNVGNMPVAQLEGVASQSCKAISLIAEKVQWVESYVTENKVYCVYLAENEAAIRAHAKAAGFPVNKISEVKLIMDPTAAR